MRSELSRDSCGTHGNTKGIMETRQPSDNHAHCPLRGKRKFMLEPEWVNRTALKDVGRHQETKWHLRVNARQYSIRVREAEMSDNQQSWNQGCWRLGMETQGGLGTWGTRERQPAFKASKPMIAGLEYPLRFLYLRRRHAATDNLGIQVTDN